MESSRWLIAKAIVPIFRLTSGTKFEVYVQDPILYILVPLYGGYMAFREVMNKRMNERVLKSTALGVAAGIVTTKGVRLKVEQNQLVAVFE